MKETTIYCDFCKKETKESTQYQLPVFVTYDARDRKGHLIKSFTTNEIADDVKDVCPMCRKKMAMLLEVIPRVTIEDEETK